MRSIHPQFDVNLTTSRTMKVCGILQPTSRSSIYRFELKYNSSNLPKVRIISPTLTMNFKGSDIPHIYKNQNLCLYFPKYREFERADYLSDTIIPWTSLWLYYYEIWHITGEWLGGGMHPNKINSK